MSSASIWALTVSQPFASLIACGTKRIENRTWETKIRGPLAIHAGKGRQYLDARELRSYPTGHVLAVVNLVSCVSLEALQRCYDLRWPAPEGFLRDGFTGEDVGRILGDEHAEGPTLWIMRDVRQFRRPIPATGKPKLWLWHAPENWENLLDEP